jgi:alpha-galactosidase
MPILWRPETRELHLHNDSVSYVICILENGCAGQLYFGQSLNPSRSYRHRFPLEFHGFSQFGGEIVRLEYPAYGNGDFRAPAVSVRRADGSAILDPVYQGHRIFPGKMPIPGLPSTYVEGKEEADSLEITLLDAPSGAQIVLSYTIFRSRAVVARSARIRNTGDERLTLTSAMSASLDMPDADWDLVQLSGGWARERHVKKRHLVQGSQSVSSLRGASSHQHNPFIALARPSTTEETGDTCGFGLVYSGNFLADVEVDQFDISRVRIGINPHGFSWILEPGAEFYTPEAVLVHSTTGLGGMSDTFHRLYRERLARGAWRDMPRPVLINNWEGTYFKFTERKILEIAEAAKGLGVELFVLDDGWFGERNDDTSSLGDWQVDRKKLPDGIEGVARKVEALGMKFGLWFEPEMVSERSRLFSAHPDWAIGAPGRPRTEGRHQYVLDMSRPEIVDHLFESVAAILRNAPISFVKWDMNRNITEPYGRSLPPDRQGEFFHRYILGVYDLYQRLTSAFPDVLFESCAGGGGRFDPGILAFAPQGWTSDDTDAFERLKIQWGTSLCYPLSSMGAHVSAVPNHQVGRLAPLATRAAVAFFGVFGYELDAASLSTQDRAEVAAQIAFYKTHRELFQRGRFLRLLSPFEGNWTAWMVASMDSRKAIVGVYRALNTPIGAPWNLTLRGLDASSAYRVAPWPALGDAAEKLNAGIRGGDELMRAGLLIGGDGWEQARQGDFWSRLFVIEGA